MSSVEHTATVDKGLKMKIKRKNLAQNSHKSDQKHELVKSEKDPCKSVSNLDGNTSQSVQNSNGLLEKSTKHCLLSEKGDKSPMKMKGAHKGEKKGKDKEKGKIDSGSIVNGGTSCAGPSVSNGLDVLFSQVSMEPRVGETAQMKREKTFSDPYEFNAKVEDEGPGIELPMKKMKSEKVETPTSPMATLCSDIGVETSNVGVSTDPDCLGPCEPGTSISLEGLVWHETENGVLVVNVTWRGKTYVGTLLDATRYDWAPPRFNCESPVNEFETRTPKGRGKRIRGTAGTPVNEKANSEGRKLRNKARRGSASFQAPPSPAKSDISVGGVKRKGRPPELDLSDSAKVKRCRSSSRGTPGTESPSPALIECPEPNCSKKYKHINGLRYHQTHAHQNLGGANQDDEEDDGDDTDAPTPPVTRAGRKSNSESDKNKDKNSLDKDNEENIPLNEIAASSKAKAAAAAAAAAAVAAAAQSSSNSADKTSKSDSNKADSSKSDSSKKKENPVTSAVTTVSSSSKVSVPTTQVYQISGAPMGCLGGVAPAVSQAASVATTAVTPSSPVPVSTPSPVSAAIPVSVSNVSTPPQAADIVKSETPKDSKDKGEKPRPKNTTRPIVPLPPAPQMIALSSSVAVTHSNLSPVSTHTQMTASLRQIQPKPTIMGEPSSLNPALASFKQDRKPNRRKNKKEKDGTNGSASVNNKQPLREQVLRDEQSMCERPAVIKTACPSRPGETPPRQENIVPTIETPKSSHETPRSTSSGSSVIATQGLGKSGEQQQAARLSQPPNVLKVNSPLGVSTPDHDRKTPVTEDVQSPAYSDISDANESSSPQQNESPTKKDDVNIKKEKGVHSHGNQGDTNMSSHYGMYSYYGQQYMMPNVSGAHMSPSTPKSHVTGAEVSSVSEDKKSASAQEDRKPDKKSDERDNVKVKSEMPNSQQMHPDYQKYMQQVYQMRTMQPQFHLGYHIDHNQYMAMMDPHVRQQYEKVLEEKRLQHEQSLKDSEGNKMESRPSSRGQSEHAGAIPKQGHQSHPGTPSQGGLSMDRLQESKKNQLLEKTSDRDVRDQNLRDKQNENHQILKENIELKSQMERPRPYDMHYDYRNQDELRRIHMFQQQKMFQEQKRRLELSSDPPELTSAESGNKKQALSRPESQKPQELLRDIKKEVIDGRKNAHGHDSAGKMNSDAKSSEDKIRPGDKHRNPMDVSKPKHHSVPSSSTASSNNQASTPTSHNASYQPYLQYQFMQSPAHYGHMPYDPNNPMYRTVNPQVLGYSGTPYLHSPQLGYPRVGATGGGATECEKEKLDSSVNKGSAVAQDAPESDAKNMDSVQGSQYYGNVHKIHELGERGRPSPHRSSPAPAKSAPGESPGSVPLQSLPGSAEKARDYSTSPPTQRHLHTHHHTHHIHPHPIYDPLTYNAPLMVAHQPHQYPSK